MKKASLGNNQFYNRFCTIIRSKKITAYKTFKKSCVITGNNHNQLTLIFGNLMFILF